MTGKEKAPVAGDDRGREALTKPATVSAPSMPQAVQKVKPVASAGSGASNAAAERLLKLFPGDNTSLGEPEMVREPGSNKLRVVPRGNHDGGPATLELWQGHFDGRHILGVWPGEACHWLGGDVDEYARSTPLALVDQIERLGLPLVTTRTKSGGARLLFTLEEPTSKDKATKLMRHFIRRLGLCEKSGDVGDTEIIFSNIWMPYNGGENSDLYALRPRTGLAMSLREFLDVVEKRRLKANDVDALLSAAEDAPKDDETPTEVGAAFAPRRLAKLCDAVAATGVGGRGNALNKAAFEMARMIGAGWIDQNSVIAALREAGLEAGMDVARVNDTLDPHRSSGALQKGKQLPPPRPGDYVIERLLDQHAVAMIGGKTRVTSRVRRWDGGEGLALSTMTDFGNYYGNLGRRTIARFGMLAQRFRGLVCAPWASAESIGEQMNLWRGWGVQPAAGNWSLIRRHMLEVVSDGEPEFFDYLLRWCAWSVQNPGARAEVAIVLRGGKGAGKGAFARALLRIFGVHGLHVSDRDHLIGKFNAHMGHCCLLFADEAYWAGDKKSEGKLKRIITEPTLSIEPKGIDLQVMANMLKIIVAGNESWVVPASDDERRYAVTEVSPARQGDVHYFKALFAQIEGEGPSAMLHELLHTDLKGWHPRESVPQNKALAAQKDELREGIDALVEAVAHAACMPCGHSKSWNIALTSGEDQRRGLWHYAKATIRGLRYASAVGMARDLKKDWGCSAWHSGGMRGVKFPPLADLRAAFEKKHGPQDWEIEADDWLEPEGVQPEEQEHDDRQRQMFGERRGVYGRCGERPPARNPLLAGG